MDWAGEPLGLWRCESAIQSAVIEGWSPQAAEVRAVAAVAIRETSVDEAVAREIARATLAADGARAPVYYNSDARNPSHSYCVPGTDVFLNRPGIEDSAVLGELEYVTAALRYVTVLETQDPVTTGFNFAYLARLHGRLFGDLYSWAGTLRTVNMSKGSTDFAHYGDAIDMVDAVARDVRAWAGQPILRDDAVALCARTFAQVNMAHPFREGNGRATRAFIHMLANHLQYRFHEEDVQRGELIHAAIAGGVNDIDPLLTLFDRHLVPLPA